MEQYSLIINKQIVFILKDSVVPLTESSASKRSIFVETLCEIYWTFRHNLLIRKKSQSETKNSLLPNSLESYKHFSYTMRQTAIKLR